MKTAILLPTIYRPAGLLRALDSIYMTTQSHSVRLVIACEEDDRDVWLYYSSQLYIAVCKEKLQGPAYAWNTALSFLEDRGLIFDLYVLASDDIEFLNGWLTEVIRIHEETDKGLIGLNDSTGKYERAGFCTHYAMTRKFIIEHNGGLVACPHYFADFTDLEIIERGEKADQFVYAKNAVLIHHHRKLDDLGYRKADEQRQKMRQVFLDRKAKGFPNDFERIVK